VNATGLTPTREVGGPCNVESQAGSSFDLRPMKSTGVTPCKHADPPYGIEQRLLS